jgi:hypothetical protein
MRRLLSGVTALSLFVAQQAQAELECLRAPERSVVEVAALRSELIVLATGCHQDESYNAFVRRYQTDLQGNEKAMGELFKRVYGKRAQQEHDRFTTELANGESSAGMHLGSDFCERNSRLFVEVMALPSAAELPAYAAGKDLVPATVEMCPQVAQAQAPTRRQAAKRQ